MSRVIEEAWRARWWRVLAAPLAWVWGGSMATRRRLYEKGWLRSTSLGVPVISVGNLVVGGTGKTPMVSALLDFRPPQFAAVSVLARGYGESFSLGGRTLNDEGHQLALRHPEVVQIQGADRVAAWRAQRAGPEAGPCEFVILDDGAQHLRVRRDFEILMMDARSLTAPQAILPAGPWRERLQEARRANLIVVTRSEGLSKNECEAMRSRLDKVAPGVDVVLAGHRPRDLASFDREGGQISVRPTTDLKGRRVALVVSIARPEAFRRTVEELGAEVAWELVRPDHYLHGNSEAEELKHRFSDQPVDLVLATEKDLPKLLPLDLGEIPWKALRVDLDFGDRSEVLSAAFQRAQENFSRARYDSGD